MASPAQIVDAIKQLTQKAQALQQPAQSISIVNGPLIVIGQGPFPQIITGLVDICSATTNTLSQMEGMPPVAAGDDSDAIFDTYKDYVRVNQALFNILLGKAGLFSTVPLIGQPTAASLRHVEGAYDTLAFSLIDGVSSRSSDLQSQAEALGRVLDQVITAYEGVAN